MTGRFHRNTHIPEVMEIEIRKRDKKCVYCGIKFSQEIHPTWEHIINDENIITFENIVLCCRSCNSSKGQKLLKDWIETEYCKKKNISYNTVTPIIKNALDDYKKKI